MHQVWNPSLWLLTWHDMINTLWGGYELGSQKGIGLRLYWLWFAYAANWMDRILLGARCRCIGRKMRGLQSARPHAKCAGRFLSTRAHAKCAGRVLSAWDAKCAEAREMRGPRLSCAGRTECVGGNCVEQWVGALPTHLPRTCHAMPTQCNRGSTHVGRDEPQSPGTLRVNIESVFSTEVQDIYSQCTPGADIYKAIYFLQRRYFVCYYYARCADHVYVM